MGDNASRQANLPQIPTGPLQNRQLPVRACMRRKRLPASARGVAASFQSHLKQSGGRSGRSSRQCNPSAGSTRRYPPKTHRKPACIARERECQQTSIRSSTDLPRIVPSHKPAWVRVADPAAEHTRLSAASENIEWLLQCFQSDLACPLRSKPVLACKAAADACAEGATVGIGGWSISSRSVSLGVRRRWPCLTKKAQRYIACFETLAQLALMRIAAWTAEGQAVHGLCMPSGTDNTASEAGVNKLFTTAWPFQIFVQYFAAWAYKHKWSVLASHIPGEHNVWADQLSRGNTSAFDSKPQACFRFRPHDFWPHKCRLSLHPPDDPWRPEHRRASQTL